MTLFADSMWLKREAAAGRMWYNAGRNLPLLRVLVQGLGEERVVRSGAAVILLCVPDAARRGPRVLLGRILVLVHRLVYEPYTR